MRNRPEAQLTDQILEHTQILLCYLDKEFNIQWFNRAWAEKADAKLSLTLGKNLFDLYPIDDYQDTFRRTVQLGEPLSLDLPALFDTKDSNGESLWKISLAPVMDQADRVCGIVVSADEVPHFTEDSKKLVGNAEDYRTLFEFANDAILVANEKDEILDVNQVMCKIMGYSRDEMLLMTVADLQAPALRQEAGTIFKNEHERYGNELFEVVNIHRDGTLIPLEIRVTHFETTSGIYFFSVMRDIRKRKRKQQELQRSIEDAQKKQQMITALGHAAAALHHCQSPEEVYDSIVEQISKIDLFVYVLKLGDDGKLLRLVSQSSGEALRGEVDNIVDLPNEDFFMPLIPGGLHDRVVNGGETLYFPDLTEPIAEAFPELQAKEIKRIAELMGFGPGIYSPIGYRDRNRGILIVMGSILTTEHIPAINAFADQATLARENARLIQTLKQEKKRLKSMSQHILYAQEEERRRIGLELHDEIGQRMTAVNLWLNRMDLSSVDQKVSSKLFEISRECGQLEKRIRDLTADLHPVVLDEFGLEKSLLTLFNRFDFEVDFRSEDLHQRRFDHHVEVAAFRIIQEAVTNAARHAGASSVTVRMWIEGKNLWIRIMDNGCGFDLEEFLKNRESLGILGMQERASFVDGKLRIETAPFQGTYISVSIPIDR